MTVRILMTATVLTELQENNKKLLEENQQLRMIVGLQYLKEN